MGETEPGAADVLIRPGVSATRSGRGSFRPTIQARGEHLEAGSLPPSRDARGIATGKPRPGEQRVTGVQTGSDSPTPPADPLVVAERDPIPGGRRFVLDRAMTGSLAAAGISQFVLIVSGVLVARSLGPEDRGYLALLTVVAAVCALIGLAGLPPALTYYIARNRAQARRTAAALVRPAIAQVGAIVALQAGALLLLVADDPPHVKLAALVSLLLGPGILVLTYGYAILQGQHRFDAFNFLRVLPTTCYVLAVLILFLLGWADLVRVMAMWAGATFGGGVLTLAVAVRRLPRPPTDAPVASTAEMAWFGAKSLLASLSPVDALRLDQVAVGLFLSPLALGHYVVAQAFTGLPRLIANSIGLVVYPRVASQPEQAAARRAVWRYFTYGFALCAVVTGALALAAGELVPLFFGSEFREASGIARLLLLAVLFMTARRILTDGASGLGHPELGTAAELASWVILVPALVLLLPPYGAEGVAVALAIAWGGSLAILMSLVLMVDRRPPAEASVGGGS